MSSSNVPAGANLPSGFEGVAAAEEEIMRSEAAYRSAVGAKS